jgi:hypothetical protein
MIMQHHVLASGNAGRAYTNINQFRIATMSLPVFKDWNKGVEGETATIFHDSFDEILVLDLFKDDFDLKYSLKVKAAGPYGIVSYFYS